MTAVARFAMATRFGLAYMRQFDEAIAEAERRLP